MLSAPQQVDNTYPAGQGEPVNIIISGDSDEEVLADNEDKGGILNYYLCAPVTTSVNTFHSDALRQIITFLRRMSRAACRQLPAGEPGRWKGILYVSIHLPQGLRR